MSPAPILHGTESNVVTLLRYCIYSNSDIIIINTDYAHNFINDELYPYCLNHKIAPNNQTYEFKPIHCYLVTKIDFNLKYNFNSFQLKSTFTALVHKSETCSHLAKAVVLQNKMQVIAMLLFYFLHFNKMSKTCDTSELSQMCL